MAYGAGEFVAVGTGGKLRPPTVGSDGGGEPWIEVSTDGINWKSQEIQYTPAQLFHASELQSVTYGKEGFVTTDGVHVLHSADGLSWDIESFQSASNRIAYVLYDGTRYILYSYVGVLPVVGTGLFPWKVSTDGVNWTDYGKITVTNGPAGEPVSIIHVAGMYEAAWQSAYDATASTVYLTATSKDGLSWTLGNPAPVTYVQYPAASVQVAPAMYDIVHTGDQYLVFGGTDKDPAEGPSWGEALYGSSMSALKTVSPLKTQNGFHPAGEPLFGNLFETHALVSNGTVTVGLGEGGLFVTTDGVTWNYESLEGVVPETGCSESYPGTPTCTAFASGAAAPGGSIVVLVAGGSAGAESMDGIHWVKSNL